MAKKDKKFEPLDRRAQSKDQRDKVDEIQGDWSGHYLVENFHGPWHEYVSFWEGDQYLFWNNDTDQMEDATPFIEREVKNVYNRITPQVRQQWGALRFSHEFYVIPNTSESEDVKAARAASIFLECTNEKGKFNGKINRAKLWALITGAAWWKEMWNRNGFGLMVNDKGAVVKVPGEVDFNYLNPFNCRPDPSALTRDGWRYFDEGKRLPSSVVEAEFELPRGSLPKISKGNTDTNIFERKNLKKPNIPSSIRIEHHEIPSGEFPKGRFMVIVGDWLLWEGTNPSPDHELPYFQIPGIIPLLDEPVYDSSVRMMQAPQKQFNRYNSLVDESLENYRLKGMVPIGSLRGGSLNAWQRAGVDYVEYNPRVGQPYWQAPPQLPSSFIQRISFLEEEIETQSSVRKPSLGQLPKYASRASGKLWEGLKGQDDAVLLPTVEDIDDSITDAMRFRLKLIQKHYDERRMLKTLGRNKQSQVANFKGTDLRDNTDVRVKRGVDIMTNRKIKQEVVFAMLDQGMLKDKREALELMDYKGVDEYMEDEFIDEQQAHYALEIMKAGKTYIAADKDDNHDTNFKVFNNFRKTQEFNTISKKAQENIRKRMQEHKNFMQPPAKEETQEELPDDAVKIGPGGTPLSTDEPDLTGPGVPPEAAALAEAIEKMEEGGQQ